MTASTGLQSQPWMRTSPQTQMTGHNMESSTWTPSTPLPSLQRKRPDRKSPSQSGHPDPSVFMEEKMLPPAGSAVEQGRTNSGSLTQRAQGKRQTGFDHTGLLTVAPSEGDAIIGSDNKIYRLLSGPPGKRGCAGRKGNLGFKGNMGVRGQEGRRAGEMIQASQVLQDSPTLYLWRNSQEDRTFFRVRFFLSFQCPLSTHLTASCL
ncbi:uncharacterized protein LOC110535863 [Oncorhynchus mykiss]|uniref:uncharacterized protein LOC110535863 n=1 Tax=Oncorhynchus mykiss TaxID=8022 RepID=UPI0018781E74|nr:uncharacterized protein LOC110535863 [Oncorhynchus mykiss]